MAWRSLALALALVTFPVAAGAQTPIDESDIQIIGAQLPDGAFEFEYGVPATPALTIIGATGDAIPRTQSLQRFALSVLRASEEAGGGAAYGFDASPFWLVDRPLSLHSYMRSSWAGRVLRRSRISAAFSEGDDTTGARAGIGFATSLLDQSDPVLLLANQVPAEFREGIPSEYMDEPFFSGCIIETVRRARDFDDRIVQVEGDLRARNQGIGDEELRRHPDMVAIRAEVNSEYEAAVEPRVAECRERTINEARRAQALDLGLAFQWRGTEADLEDLDEAGSTIWLTYLSRAIGPRELPTTQEETRRDRHRAIIRGIAHARFDAEAVEFDSNGNRIEFDRVSVSIGAERVTRRSALSLQASYEESDGPAGTAWDGETSRYVARADFNLSQYGVTMLGDGVWISASVGEIDREGDDEDESYLSVALRFKAPERAIEFPDSWATRGNQAPR